MFKMPGMCLDLKRMLCLKQFSTSLRTKTMNFGSRDVCVLIIERLSMTLRQTANGKNETFADCPQLSVQYSETIFICGV